MPYPRTPELSRRIAAVMVALTKAEQLALAETPGRTFADLPTDKRALIQRAERGTNSNG